jgi:sucrose-6-phosphate hydrolase SacC (GH32 family)
MTAARRIGLKSTPNGLRLSQLAVSPFANTTWKWRGDDYDKLNAELRGRGSSTFELRATIAAGEFAWKLLSGGGAHTMVGYANGELYVDRTESGATAFSKDFPARTAVKLAPVSGEVKLRILVDRSSVEVFTQDGLVAITNLVFPPEGATGLAFVGNPKHAAIELLTSPSLPLR